MPYRNNPGIRIHYEVEGAGPPLVLHHGTLGSWEHWRDFGYLDALNWHYLTNGRAQKRLRLIGRAIDAGRICGGEDRDIA